MAHAARQIAFDGLDHDMVVVIHQAPGVAHPVEAGTGIGEDVQPKQAVGIVVVDVFTAVATRGDVVESAGKFNAQRSGHAQA
jgi:hypothetical protein